MFWTLVFLEQSTARCLTLEQIMYGYRKGIIVGLTGCIIISIIGSIVLVGTTSITISSLFCYDKFPWHDLFFHNLNNLAIV
jgi:hypothetical protein